MFGAVFLKTIKTEYSEREKSTRGRKISDREAAPKAESAPSVFSAAGKVRFRAIRTDQSSAGASVIGHTRKKFLLFRNKVEQRLTAPLYYIVSDYMA